MASQVGFDNDNRHFDDMARSIETETTLSSTSNESPRSDKENAVRHDDAAQRTSSVRLESKDVKDQFNVVKQDGDTPDGVGDKEIHQERTSAVKLKLKGEDERFNVVTLSKEIESDKADDESSILSEDFEDNDFDALVGEFFWYLRDKERSKLTPRSSKTQSSMSNQDRTPRAMGGDRVHTPRSAGKRSGFEDKEASERSNVSLQVCDGDRNIDPTPKETLLGTGDDRILTPRKDEMDACESSSSLLQVDSTCRVSTPEGTPRSAGGNSILTPRNGDKNEGFQSSKTADRTNRSLNFDKVEESDYQKENLTSILFGDIDEDEESEAIPVPPVAFENHLDSSKVDAICGDSLSNENLKSKELISTSMTSECVDLIDNTKAEKMTPSRSEVDCLAYDVWTKKGLMKQTPTPVKGFQSRIEYYGKDGDPVEKNHQMSPPRASVSPRETRDDDVQADFQQTPADFREYGKTYLDKDVMNTMDEEDFRALKVWAKKGLTRDSGTAIKVASSCVEDKEDDGDNRIFVPRSSVLSPVSRCNENIVTLPPLEKIPSDSDASPSKEKNSDNVEVTANAIEGNEEEFADDISLDFDADKELSRILDEPNDEALDDGSTDFELCRILDDSPGVNTIMSLTRNFLERQQHLLNSAHSQQVSGATPAAKSNSLPSNNGNTPFLEIFTGESESTLASDASVQETSKAAEEPVSSFVVASSKSIVAEGSSVKLSAPSPTSVHGRETPAGFINCKMVSAEPDGYLMDDESSCLTTPSLSPASANTGGTKVRFEEKLPEYQKETQMAQQFPNIGTFSPLSANSEVLDDDFGVSSKMKGLSESTGPNQTNESSIVFDCSPREELHMKQAVCNEERRSDDSTSSGKTYGSFEALSEIEKKPSSPPNLSDSTLILTTSIVFDSPGPTQNPLEGDSAGTKPPLGRTDAPKTLPDPILRNSSMPAEILDEADPIMLNRSASMSESSSSSSESTSSTSTALYEDTDDNNLRALDTVDTAVYTQTTIVLESLADSTSRSSTVPTRSSANLGDLVEVSLHKPPTSSMSAEQLPSIHSGSGSETVSHTGTVKSSGSQTDDDEESIRLPYAMPQSIQFSDSHSIEESVEGPSSLTYSLSLASKEQSLSTAGTASPLNDALQLVKSEETVAASPLVASGSDNVVEVPAPKPLTPRRRSSRFNNILGQWKQKSEHNHNGHFLSPPSNDTAPNHSKTPPATTRTPLRRRSTGECVPVANPNGETTLPRWTPQSQSQRRKSIDISSITIPNKATQLSNQRAKDSTKTVAYWNGMIQNEGTPSNNKWTSRSVTRRESSEQANLMLTVPKEDPMGSLSMSFSKDTIGTSATYQDDDVPCTCTESAFSGNDQLLEFFLPKLGMAHTCGKRNPPILIDSDPIGLHHILRPWQVEFLRSCDIYRGDQLVKACKNRAGSLAGAMRKWRENHDMTCPRSAACGMALHIWSRTCKYYVRTIRRQMADGLVEVEPPCLHDVMTTVQSKDTSFLSSEGGESRVE